MDSGKLGIAFAAVMGPLALLTMYLVWENTPRHEDNGDAEQSELRQQYERDRQRFESVAEAPAPIRHNSGPPQPPAPPKPVAAPVPSTPAPAPVAVVDTPPPSPPAAPAVVVAPSPPPQPVAPAQALPEPVETKAVIKLNFDMPQNQMKLDNGSLIDLTASFEEISRTVERARDKATAPQAMTLTYPNGKPMIYLARSGDKLDGVSAAFYEFGNPMTCASYENGKRDGSFCAWDDKDRPIYLFQYANDKKHGYCCIFRTCDTKCNHAHLWLIQEWKAGKLYAAHYVQNGSVVSHKYDGVEFQPFERDADFTLANNELNNREKQFDSVERPAKQWAVDYTNYLRTSAKLNRAIAAQNRAALQERMRITISIPQPRLVCATGYSCAN